MPDGSVIDSGC